MSPHGVLGRSRKKVGDGSSHGASGLPSQAGGAAGPNLAPPHRAAADRWLVELYDELRRLARAHMAGCSRRVTLQPTVLVHDAFKTLVTSSTVKRGWNDKRHFFYSASLIMRHQVIDWALSRKRRGSAGTVPLIEALEIPALRHFAERIEELEEALQLLEKHHPRWELVIRYRWFMGMTIAQTAEMMGVGERTVTGDWRFAQAWLRARLEEGRGGGSAG